MQSIFSGWTTTGGKSYLKGDEMCIFRKKNDDEFCAILKNEMGFQTTLRLRLYEYDNQRDKSRQRSSLRFCFKVTAMFFIGQCSKNMNQNYSYTNHRILTILVESANIVSRKQTFLHSPANFAWIIPAISLSLFVLISLKRISYPPLVWFPWKKNVDFQIILAGKQRYKQNKTNNIGTNMNRQMVNPAIKLCVTTS